MEKIKKLLKIIGPGFVTGAADDDPSGIATYSQTGALFGYSQLWLAFFTTPFMIVIQMMCGRIGIVTGRGLAGIIRANYSKKVLYGSVFLLLIANTVNIGADLGAMANAGQLLLGLPFIIWLLVITLVTLALQIFVSYKVYARFLKYLTFSLFAYIITAFVVKQNWTTVIYSTLVPHFSFSKDYILNIVAILGTTISPYLFFWQAGEEVEEMVEKKKMVSMGKGRSHFNILTIKHMNWDTAAGMLFSNIVMFFIITTTASTLQLHNIKNVETAAQAAQALRPFAGQYAFLLFALGILGTGLLAVPVLSGSASYALSETFGWKEGLYRKFKDAHMFYGVITIATLIGVIVNFTPIKPFQLLYYTAVLNGAIAPVLMILIMLIASNRKIMGKYINSTRTNILGWIVTVLMFIATIILIGSFFVK